MTMNKSLRRQRTPRAIIACTPCRQFKTKCDQQHPCSYCTANKLDCVYRSQRFVRERSGGRGGKRPTQITPILQQIPTAAADSQPSYPNVASRSELNGGRAVVFTEDNSELPIDGVIPLAEGEHENQQSIDFGEVGSIVQGNEQNGTTRDDSDSGIEESKFGHVLSSERGPEFFGPSALLSFVKRLRRSAERVRATIQPGNHEKSLGGDIVMPIHEQNAEDSTSPHTTRRSHSAIEAFLTARRANHKAIDLEKECVRQYFSNLHNVYPLLDWTTFSVQCERFFAHETPSTEVSNASFLALYCAVLALGAVTASPETSPEFKQDNIAQYIQIASTFKIANVETLPEEGYTPLSLGWWYFKLARRFVGDAFAKVTLEKVQTLFLMSLFTKHALKPHSAYMYSSMALRGAFAMGMGNQPDVSKTSVMSIRLFWVMYYHELDICCSLGREPMLREPQYYPVYLAPWGADVPAQLQGYEEQAVRFSRAMTELAQILRRISESIYHPRVSSDDENTVLMAMRLDADLDQLQTDVVSVFNLNEVSLIEPEPTTKRKVILKLRFYRARILLHRRTLLTAAARKGVSHYDQSARICIEAAEQTIGLLYDTYLYRPYFRSWWDNIVHAFDATCILLFATISGIRDRDPAQLHEVIRKSCQIFDAMRTISVAQRCADFARDLLYIAETAFNQGYGHMLEQLESETGNQQLAGEQIPAQVLCMADFQPLQNQGVWNDDLLAALTAPEPMDVLDLGFDTFFAIEEMPMESIQQI